MPFFPSDEWIKAFADQVNRSAHTEFQAWQGDFYIVVLPEDTLTQPVYLYVDLHDGQCREAYVVQNAADKRPVYTLSAPLSIWRKIIQGKLHLTVAIARHQVNVEGSTVKLLRNIKFVQALLDHATRIPSTFPE